MGHICNTNFSIQYHMCIHLHTVNILRIWPWNLKLCTAKKAQNKTSKAIQPHNNTSNFNSHQHFLHSSTAQVLKPESFPNKPSNAYPWSIFQSSATNKFHCLKVASLRKDDRNLQQQQKSFERIKSCPQMYSISKKEAGSDQSSILLFIISFFVYWCILYILLTSPWNLPCHVKT